MAWPEGGVSMERATQKDEHGYYLVGDGIYSDEGVPEKFRGDDVDRLAAYEETGLEPGEIEKIKQDVEDGHMKSTSRRYGIDVSRLGKLAQADRLIGKMVPVVRCARCRHGEAFKTFPGGIFCPYIKDTVPPDGYCYMGEENTYD